MRPPGPLEDLGGPLGEARGRHPAAPLHGESRDGYFGRLENHM